MAQDGYPAHHLKNTIDEMNTRGFLNQELVGNIGEWDRGIREKRFPATARNLREGLARTMAILRGAAEFNEQEFGKKYLKEGKIMPRELPETTEAHWRLKLEGEMAIVLRNGGIRSLDGSVDPDVARFVRREIFRYRPDLERESSAPAEADRKPAGATQEIIDAEYTVRPLSESKG
jgi:hypothetical protein